MQSLAVRTDELYRHVRARPFLALPREEIQRLHASVEVLPVDDDAAEGTATSKRLVTFTVVHHNYSWLTYTRRQQEPRWLGIMGPAHTHGQPGLFLDDDMTAAACRCVDAELATRARFEIRLAGLINDDETEFGRGHLGLVYVARLRQPGVETHGRAVAEPRFCGSGELVLSHDQFERWSQVLIQNLQAL